MLLWYAQHFILLHLRKIASETETFLLAEGLFYCRIGYIWSPFVLEELINHMSDVSFPIVLAWLKTTLSSWRRLLKSTCWSSWAPGVSEDPTIWTALNLTRRKAYVAVSLSPDQTWVTEPKLCCVGSNRRGYTLRGSIQESTLTINSEPRRWVFSITSTATRTRASSLWTCVPGKGEYCTAQWCSHIKAATVRTVDSVRWGDFWNSNQACFVAQWSTHHWNLTCGLVYVVTVVHSVYRYYY